MTDWDFAVNIAEIKPLVSFVPPPVPQVGKEEEKVELPEKEETGEKEEAADNDSSE